MIRYCQLEKGIVVIDGDAGIGKTKAATKFLRDNPSTTVYVSITPSTSSVRSLLRMIRKGFEDFGKSENRGSVHFHQGTFEKYRQCLIIDEAQNLKIYGTGRNPGLGG